MKRFAIPTIFPGVQWIFMMNDDGIQVINLKGRKKAVLLHPLKCRISDCNGVLCATPFFLVLLYRTSQKQEVDSDSFATVV